MKSERTVLEVISLDNPFDEPALKQLESVLPGFLATRRWFRSKARTIQKAVIEDVLPAEGRAYILVIRLDYSDGNSDDYLLTVTFGDASYGEEPPVDSDVIATYRTGSGSEGHVYDSLGVSSFRSWLLEAIAENRRIQGRTGELRAAHTKAFRPERDPDDPTLDSFVGRAEQSNTSIVYGDRYILKLFRKIEPGINPDLEIGAFLTECGFRHTPAVLGQFEYTRRQDGTTCAAGILQAFVVNRGDAWKYTLESLNDFFDRALASNQAAPKLATHHPLQLASEPITPEAHDLLSDYAEAAHLLGQRTAELHRTLADPEGGHAFAPEPFRPADGQKLYQEMLGQADIAFELLRQKQTVLRDTVAEDARTLLRLEHSIAKRFLPLRDQPISAARIRCHGDYHLGQVLYTGADFMIIDFEGEPARPLNERRDKALAMRDAAGMVRSFQYAAYSALFARQAGTGAKESSAVLESWADWWTAAASAAYLRGYFSVAKGSPFVSKENEEQHVIFDSFLLQKALYELAYELNNRPDWVRIPLRGILSLIN